MSKPFETRALRMEHVYCVRLLAPSQDVERLMMHIVHATPLIQGAYDSNAWVSAAGTERYRPLEGARAGTESEVRQRPGVVELRFEVPYDRQVLEAVLDTIYEVHSYQEPVIEVTEILTSRTKGLDDSTNPNRWWNTTGDWKTA
ncbi:MAG: hypothetical protein GC150_14660 [Rhizobiales bacterium]|nr:hypothetical protein [Hyphomicrobiales bacterium]